MDYNEKLKTLLEMYRICSNQMINLLNEIGNLSGEEFELLKLDYESLAKNKQNILNELTNHFNENKTKQDEN
jgi:hypothetical protein